MSLMPSSALETQFCHSLAGTEGGYSGDPDSARPQKAGDYGIVRPSGHQYPT